MNDDQLKACYSESHILKTKLNLFESLYSGGGLSEILSVAETYFQMPLFICDTSFHFLGASSLSNNVSYGIKYSNGKAYLDSPEVESLKKHHIVDSIFKSTEAFVCISPDHPTNPWIFCSIRVKNILVGFLAISYTQDSPAPTQFDLDVATATTHVISLEMQKHELYTSKTGLRYEYLLTSILEGQFSDNEMIQSRFKLLDKPLKRYFCLVSISMNETYDSTLFNRNLMETLRSIYQDSMSVNYKGINILLINQSVPIQFNDSRASSFVDILSRNRVKAGISQNFTNILEAPSFYHLSISTLDIGKKIFPDQTLYHSTDILPYLWFSKFEKNELSTFIHYQLHELIYYDHIHNSELAPTLKCYLKHNRNASATALFLDIHRSTLFYRIKKIEEILSITINDSISMLNFELSFLIMDILNSTTQL